MMEWLIAFILIDEFIQGLFDLVQVFVTCPVTEEFTEDNTAFTHHNCSIGNPFRGGRSV